MAEDDHILHSGDARADLLLLEKIARRHVQELARQFEAAQGACCAVSQSPQAQAGSREEAAIRELRDELHASDAMRCWAEGAKREEAQALGGDRGGDASFLDSGKWAIFLQLLLAVFGVWLGVMVYWLMK